jgi:hypothetical protein
MSKWDTGIATQSDLLKTRDIDDGKLPRQERFLSTDQFKLNR